MLFELSRVKAAEVTDGTSHTLLVGEITGRGAGSYTGQFYISWNVMSTENGINFPLRFGKDPATGLLMASPWSGGTFGFGSLPPRRMPLRLRRRKRSLSHGHHLAERPDGPDHAGRRRSGCERRMTGKAMTNGEAFPWGACYAP